MIRILLSIVLLVVIAVGAIWHYSRSLPEWYQPEINHHETDAEKLGEQISQQGVGQFLGSKFAGVMNGNLQLSEAEFNVLLRASLQADPDGRRLLSVSDALKVEIRQDELELGIVLDLDKVSRLDARSRRAVERVSEALPFLDSKVFLAVAGQPVARNDEIAFTDDFTVTIGMLPVSSDLLSQLGVPVHKASRASLPLQYLRVKSIQLEQDRINLGVLPKF